MNAIKYAYLQIRVGASTSGACLDMSTCPYAGLPRLCRELEKSCLYLNIDSMSYIPLLAHNFVVIAEFLVSHSLSNWLLCSVRHLPFTFPRGGSWMVNVSPCGIYEDKKSGQGSSSLSDAGLSFTRYEVHKIVEGLVAAIWQQQSPLS